MKQDLNWRAKASGKRGIAGPMSQNTGGRTIPATQVSSAHTKDPTKSGKMNLGSISNSPVAKRRA